MAKTGNEVLAQRIAHVAVPHSGLHGGLRASRVRRRGLRPVRQDATESRRRRCEHLRTASYRDWQVAGFCLLLHGIEQELGLHLSNRIMHARRAQLQEAQTAESIQAVALKQVKMLLLGGDEFFWCWMGASGWLVDCSVGWSVGWLAGWLVDWLVEQHAAAHTQQHTAAHTQQAGGLAGGGGQGLPGLPTCR